MKYYLIAGEASGDLHGSNLMKGLLRSDPQAEFRFWGGDLMAAVGGREHLAKHYRDASFFGIGEIVRRLPTVLAQIRECKRDIVAYAPDVLVLIDYPGFNFRMAKFAHGCGIRVFYYISPKVWAWKEHRVERIRRYVDKLFIIFPFEVEYFARRGIDAVYEGNPLMDAIAERCAAMLRGRSSSVRTFRRPVRHRPACRQPPQRGAQQPPFHGSPGRVDAGVRFRARRGTVARPGAVRGAACRQPYHLSVR